MARKTFISYKYSEGLELRDKIINKLGTDSRYYQGENNDTPCKDHLEEDTIKSHLKTMLFDTSVLIVILSPNMKQSEWIDWEIKYALRKGKRGNKSSKENGIVAVIQKVNNSYEWLVMENGSNVCGKNTISYKNDNLPEIIHKNRFNNESAKCCNNCNTYDYNLGSYISIIKEEEFLANPNDYIDKAFDKMQNHIHKFDLYKEING
jgi:hypothetical protein